MAGYLNFTKNKDKNKAPAGWHRMPDGTLMRGDAHMGEPSTKKKDNKRRKY